MRKKKSLLFITEASEKVGFGHFSRSIELFKEFQKTKTFTLWFLAACKQDKLSSFIKQRNIAQSKNIVSIYNLSNKKVIEIIKQGNHSCVIFDTQNEYKDLRSFLKKTNIRTISLDFFFNRNIPDISINLYNHKILSYAENQRVYSGPQYAIIRDELIRVRKSKTSIKNYNYTPKKCLILMGGADPSENSLKAINLIKYNKNSFFHNLEIEVVIGPLFSLGLRKKIMEQSIGNPSIKIIDSPENIVNLFLENDFMFCGAGTTLLEAMSIGMPTFVIPQSKEEYAHARFYNEKGSCFLIHDEKKFSKHQFNIDLLKTLQDNALKIIDQKGKKRIFKIINDVINE